MSEQLAQISPTIPTILFCRSMRKIRHEITKSRRTLKGLEMGYIGDVTIERNDL
jgi:hypothetical protein